MALDAPLREAIGRLAAVDRLLVAMDFDGVMAPFVERPQDARPLPESAEALRRLASARGTTTALLSGRDLAALRHVASPAPETLLVGSHGAERWAPRDAAGEAGVELDAAQRALLADVRERFAAVVAAHPATKREDKPAGTVLHVRGADPAVARDALEAGRAAVAGLEGLKVTEGKAVLETSVVAADKGAGLEWLRRAAAADAVLFAGDDVTDEHAFAVLGGGDVGVKVGDGATAAAHRVAGIGDVPGLLAEVLRVRS